MIACVVKYNMHLVLKYAYDTDGVHCHELCPAGDYQPSRHPCFPGRHPAVPIHRVCFLDGNGIVGRQLVNAILNQIESYDVIGNEVELVF